MTTIYVVASGYYSDYSICGVYDTLELAELAQKFYRDAHIEEYVLNEHAVLLRSGKSVWHVEFRETGEIKDVFHLDDFEITGDEVRLWGEKSPIFPFLTVQVITTDEVHARKIAVDKRSEYLAKKAGV